MNRIAVFSLLAVALLLGCDTVLPRSNPFDPEAAVALQARARIEGVVLGAEADGTTAPLAGAQVWLDGPTAVADLPRLTGQDGAFAFTDLMPGRYELLVAHPSRSERTRILEPGPGDTSSLELVLPASAATSALEGRAQRAGDTEHGGILVEIAGTAVATQTARSGAFHLEVSPGTYDLVFSHPGWVDARVEGVVVPPGGVQVLAEAAVLQADPATVRGTVRLEGRGELEHGGVSVAVRGAGVTTLTAPDGSFTLTGIAQGTWVVAASLPDYVGAVSPALVLEGGADLTLPDPLSLARARGAIAGRVELVDGNADSQDNGGVTVGITGTGLAAVTTDSGAFLLERVPTGSYELATSRPGFVRGTVAGVVVAEGEVAGPFVIPMARLQGDFLIDGGAAYTSDTEVTLAFPGVDPLRFRVSEDPSFADPGLGDTDFVSFSSPRTFTLSGGDGPKLLYVEYEDQDGVVTGPFQSGIVLDATPPQLGSPALLLADGRAATNAATGVVSAAFSATDATSGVLELQLSDDASFASAAWEPFVLSRAQLLPSPGVDGPKTLHVRFRDRAGNTSAAASASIRLDRVKPVVTLFLVDEGRSHTRSSQVLLSVGTDDPDVTHLALSNDPGFPVEVFQPFAASAVWMLSPGDGVRTVSVKLMDAAGNVTDALTDDILVDTTAPAGVSLAVTGTVAEGGSSQTLTGTGAVTLALSAADSSALTLEIANDAAFTAAVPEPFAASRSWQLAAGDGPKRVFARVTDAAGNRAVAEAQIDLDTTPPRFGAVEVATAESRTATVELSLYAEDAASMRIRTDAAFDAEPWVGFARNATAILQGADGTKTVTAIFRDAAGNVGPETTAEVVLDTTAPTAPTLELVGTVADGASSATLTGTRTVSARPNAQGAVFMQLSADSGFAGAAWRPFASEGEPWLLSGADGAHTVHARFRDAAGNVSATASAWIELDTLAPATPGLVLAGGAEWTNAPGPDHAVGAELTASGADAMRIAADGVLDDEPWVALSASSTVRLPAGEGTKVVAAQTRDAAGNASAVVTDTVALDLTAPRARVLRVGDGSGFVRVRAGETLVEVDCADGQAPGALLTVALTDESARSCFSGPWSPSVGAALGADEGARSLTAACVDPAGNQALSPAVGFILDGTPPEVTVFTLNGGVPGELTGSAAVLARFAVDDVHASPAAVALAETPVACQGAAFVHPASGEVAVTLSPGDGSRSLYLCALDAAGNVTPTAVPSANAVLLDTAGPAIPALVRTALSDREIALAWSLPPDAARFEIERRRGSEGSFTAIASEPAPTSSLTDALTPAVLGQRHRYRIRAFDLAGNDSGWSPELDAGIPIARPQARYFHSDADRRLTWDIPPGTVLVTGSYSWESEGIRQDVALPANVRHHQLPPEPAINERIVLRTANGDGSLVWESDFRFGHHLTVLDSESNSGFAPSIEIDAQGVAHVAYFTYLPPVYELRYLKLDGSTPVLVAEVDVSVDDLKLRPMDLAVGPDGVAYVFYFDATTGMNLRRMDGTSSATVVEAVHKGPEVTIGIGSDGVPHLAWHDARFVADGQDLEYLRHDGVSVRQTLDTAASNSGRSPSLAVDSTAVAHLAYLDRNAETTVRYLRVDGVSLPQSLPQQSGAPSGSVALGLDSLDVPHLAWVETVGPEDMALVYQRLDGVSAPQLVSEVLDSGSLLYNASGYATLAVDPADDVHLAWYQGRDKDLQYFRRGDGFQQLEVATLGTVGEGASIAVDAEGAPHLVHYARTSRQLEYARLDRGVMARRVGPKGRWTAALAVDSTGLAHAAWTPVSNTLSHATLGRRIVTTVVDTAGSYFDFVNLAVNGADEPIAVYTDIGGPSLRWAKIGGAPPKTLLTSAGAGLSATLDSADKLHLAFRKGSKIGYARVGDTGLVELQRAPDAVTNAVGMSVAVQSTGQPHLVYGQTGSTDLRYVAIDLGAPTILTDEALTGLVSGFRVQSLVADPADAVHLVYHDTGVGELRHRVVGASVDEVLDAMQGAGKAGVTFAIAPDGTGHVAYFELHSRTVRYLAMDGIAEPVAVASEVLSPIALYGGSALAFDRDGGVHLLYTSDADASLHYVRGPLVRPVASVCDGSPPTPDCARQVQ